MADSHAKRAAAGESSPTDKLPTLLQRPPPSNIAALWQSHVKDLKAQWKTQWVQSPRYNRIRFYQLLPSDSFLTFLRSSAFTRAQASLLFQLRTGHIALNCYLHRINRIATPQCPACGLPRETVIHFLFECPAHLSERIRHFQQWKQKERDLSFLLSNTKAALSVISTRHRTRVHHESTRG
jgi:hypothetical protein